MIYLISLNFKYLCVYVFINENKLGKINFFIGKNGMLNPLGILCIHKIFGLRKGPADYTISESKGVHNYLLIMWI